MKNQGKCLIIPKKGIVLRIDFECENCHKTIDNLDLSSGRLSNTYVHCKDCDTYYKLLTDKDPEKTTVFLMATAFYLKKVSKKEIFENAMNNERYDVIEV